MTDILQTERLTLRRLEARDAAPITEALQEIDVVRWIPRMPWPYTQADAETFIHEVAAREDLTYGIEHAGKLVGSVSGERQLGYWLAKDAWGQGFATEASRAVLAKRFAQDDTPVPSGHRVGNARSRHVLTKLGFRDTVTRTLFCTADGRDVTLQDMELTKSRWQEGAA